MWQEKPIPTRFIGLDVHKHYLVAIGVDPELKQVSDPRPVPLVHLDSWMGKVLTLQDEVVLEMTTSAFQLYDDLLPHVHSVTLVHPPHFADHPLPGAAAIGPRPVCSRRPPHQNGAALYPGQEPFAGRASPLPHASA
jgi:hypothetical protein